VVHGVQMLTRPWLFLAATLTGLLTVCGLLIGPLAPFTRRPVAMLTLAIMLGLLGLFGLALACWFRMMGDAELTLSSNREDWPDADA
jgi:drug/metabolite transporter (DMT)-like permease